MPGSNVGWFETTTGLGLCFAFSFAGVTGEFSDASINFVKSGEKSTTVGASEDRFASDEEPHPSDGVRTPAASFLGASGRWPILGFRSMKWLSNDS